MKSISIDLRDVSTEAERRAVARVHAEFEAARVADNELLAEERRTMANLARAQTERDGAVVALAAAGLEWSAAKIRTATTTWGIREALRGASNEIRGTRFSGDHDGAPLDRAEEALKAFKAALDRESEVAPCG